ncbi:MAG: ParB/RepB/Spo0J family partition protein [Thermoplasmatota archaeon]
MSASTEPNAQQLTTDSLASAKDKRGKNLSLPEQSHDPVDRRPVKSEPKSIVVDVALVDEDPDNARITFDQAELKILGESLKDRQLAAISVRSTKDGRYTLVDGARRLRAAKLAGIKQLRADDWGTLDEVQAAVAAATANLEREDLTPYEEARAFDRLVKAKVPKKEICETFGIPFNTLQSRLELLELPDEVGRRVGDARKGLAEGALGLGHAKAFLPYKGHPAVLREAVAWLDRMQKGNYMPDPTRFEYELEDHLRSKNLVRNINRDVSYGAAHDKIVKRAKEIAVDVKRANGGTAGQLVFDVAAFDKISKEERAAAEARDAKEAAAARSRLKVIKPDPVKEKAQRAREDRAKQIDKLAEPITLRLKAAAIAGGLVGPKRPAHVWRMLAVDLNENHPVWDARGASLSCITAVAKALKLDDAEVGKTFAENLPSHDDGAKDLDEEPVPAWFAKAKPEQQQAFATALRAVYEVGSSGGEGLLKAFTGTAAAQFESQAKAEAREELARRETQAARDAKAVAATDWKAHERTLDCKMCGRKGMVVAPNQKKCPRCGCSLTDSLVFGIRAKATANSKSAKKPAGLTAKDVRELDNGLDKALAMGGPKKRKPTGGAAGKGPTRTSPAPKTKGKAKAVVKVTPAVAKARATLAKGKQAVLMASPAPKPLEAPVPVASRSPRDIADEVLADVLPGLKAVKQAAQDNGIQV